MGCQVSSSLREVVPLVAQASLNINTSSTDQGHSNQDRVTIDALSDDCLLCIFDYYNEGSIWPWHALVHTCRRWRHLVFSFPGYLNLRHVCRSKTHLKAALDIWPALPIDIEASFEDCAGSDEDDIIGALEYRDRIANISLWGIRSAAQLKKCIKLMQRPFPLLTSLYIVVGVRVKFVITDALFGGSAPRLRNVRLSGGFPTLPNLLSSTRHLVDLRLEDFPVAHNRRWLISPEAMAKCLSLLTRLQTLDIALRWNVYPPSQPPPNLAPTIFPALTYFTFEGPHDYLEGLIARIDAPRLDNVHIHIWDDPIRDDPVLDLPCLAQFIQRAETSKFPLRLDVDFEEEGVFLDLRSSIGPAKFYLSFLCTQEITSQLELMTRICASCPLLFSQVKRLKINGDFDFQWFRSDTMSNPWLGFLQPFTAVDTLFFGIIAAPHVAAALGSLTERGAAEVLPMLQTIILGSHPKSDELQATATELLNPFIVARDQVNCPVTIGV